MNLLSIRLCCLIQGHLSFLFLFLYLFISIWVTGCKLWEYTSDFSRRACKRRSFDRGWTYKFNVTSQTFLGLVSNTLYYLLFCFILSVYYNNTRGAEHVEFETVASIKDPLIAKVITPRYSCVCLVPVILSSLYGQILVHNVL